MGVGGQEGGARDMEGGGNTKYDLFSFVFVEEASDLCYAIENSPTGSASSSRCGGHRELLPRESPHESSLSESYCYRN